MTKETHQPNGNPPPEVKEIQFDVVPPDEARQALEIYGKDPFALDLPKDLPKVDFINYGKRLATAIEMAGWRVGDYAVAGQDIYQMSYEEMAAETGFVEGTLRNAAVAARATPLQFRSYGLEKMRLMLGRRGEKETVAKLVKRLGKKTHKQLRQMGATGGGGGGGGGGEREVTATALYEEAASVVDLLERFDSNNKLVALVALESDKETGGIIFQLSRFTKALSDQLIGAGAKTPTE